MAAKFGQCSLWYFVAVPLITVPLALFLVGLYFVLVLP